MSYQPLWLRDLVAYSIQAAALVGVGVVLARALRLRVPRVCHAYWQALLVVCVFLPLLQPWRPEILETPGFTMSNITLATTEAGTAPTGPSLAEIVLWLICAGIALRIVWMALGLGRLWLYRRRAQRIDQVPQAVEDAQRLAPVSPSFFISQQLPTPATFGFFRPTVLFPVRFLEMEPAMQKAIALHELLHVERRDWLWNMFEETVLTLLWFHFPVWWVVRSARLSREQVVDAEAVRRSNARRPYLKALLEMAGQKRLAESLPAPLFLRESQLADRVALMMKEAHMSRTRLTVSILTAATTLLIAGATLAWTFPLRTSAPQTEASGSASGQSGVSQENKKTEAVPQKRKGETESRSRTKQHKPLSVIVTGPSVKIDQAEIQRQVDEAMKQVQMAQEVAPKIDQKKLQEQIEQAMKQAEIAQKNLVKIDQERVRQQMEEAMKQVEKLNTPEMRLKMQQQMKQLQEMNTQEMQQKMQEAMKQLQEINLPEMHRQFQEQMEQLKKIDTPEMQEQLRHAMEQAKVAQEAAAKVNKAELQRQLEQARKEAQQARKEAQVAREEARKARQDAMKARREAEEERKAGKPAPSATPKPAPAPPKEITPPLPPPAPPALPKTPESAGIVGGVRGGVVGGVAGGITRGVITAPQPPVPPSTSPKVVAPSPPPASPAPPSPPQD